jgi:uncharacterized protein (DUF1501 family)
MSLCGELSSWNSERHRGMTTIISRRGIIRLGGCSLGMLGLSGLMGRLGLISAMAQSATEYQALVCIFLFGGNDSNNIIVPIDSRYKQYQGIRSNLALSEAELLPIAAADGTPYGLHPKLRELQGLYEAGVGAFVLNVGTLVQPTNRVQYQANVVPVPWDLFAHDQQQIQWQSGIPSLLDRPTGWGGKMADSLTKVGLTGGSLPPNFSVAAEVMGDTVFLTGENTKKITLFPGVPPALSRETGAAGAARDTAMRSLLSFDTGLSLVRATNSIASDAFKTMQLLTSTLAKSPGVPGTFPNSFLGQQLKQVAQIIQVRSEIKASRQIFFCAMVGFDTHFDQLVLQAPLLQQFSQAVDAFYATTAALGVASQVTTFTASDFNRTFQPNSLGGSDHGWGGHHMVVGGAVKGRNVYGQLPELLLNGGDDTDTRGVWIPSISLDQYAATLGGWLGVPVGDLRSVFPNLHNFGIANLGFMDA